MTLPAQGDKSHNVIFRFVGLVVTSWESLEFELSRLYSVFAGEPDGESLQEEYGAGRIFKDRLAILRRGAEKYHIAHPNQDHEGGFAFLCTASDGFAARRHEVAHGIGLRVDRIAHFQRMFEPWYGEKPQWLLVPPLYAKRWHDKGLPSYAYSSKEMNELAARLLELGRVVGNYRRMLLGLPRSRTKHTSSFVQMGHPDD